MPKDQQTIVGTLLQVLNGLIQIFACIYFYFISKEWLGFEIFGWTLNLIVVLFLYFIPESPKYLLSKKRYDEARNALIPIAQLNNLDKSK